MITKAKKPIDKRPTKEKSTAAEVKKNSKAVATEEPISNNQIRLIHLLFGTPFHLILMLNRSKTVALFNDKSLLILLTKLVFLSSFWG